MSIVEVFAFAGVMILASLLLAYYVSPYWLALTAFVGLNMLQAAFTGFCPAADDLRQILASSPVVRSNSRRVG